MKIDEDVRICGAPSDLVGHQRQSAADPDLLALIRARRSIRRYTGAPLDDNIIEQILAAGASAPSAHNRQPWRFAVLKSHDARKCLAEAMAARLRRDRLADADSPEIVEADAARSIARIVGAPTAILVCLTMEDMDPYPDEHRSRAEYLMAVQSTAMATQNLQLAATAFGLGASIMCAPLFCPDTVREALDLPTGWEAQALLTLGVPANTGKPFIRRPMHDIARHF